MKGTFNSVFFEITSYMRDAFLFREIPKWGIFIRMTIFHLKREFLKFLKIPFKL